MTDVWTQFVAGVQGQRVRPVNILGLQARRFDMGRPVGQFQEPEDDTDLEGDDTAPAAVQAPQQVTKASRVRALLLAAKQAGCTDKTQQVEPVMEALNMSRSQATSYVKAHWDRV